MIMPSEQTLIYQTIYEQFCHNNSLPHFLYYTTTINPHPHCDGTPSHSHFSSSSFLTLVTNKMDPFPYPPPIQVKHPMWFLNDANLFLSHRETLFGFHQEIFQTTYFSTI